MENTNKELWDEVLRTAELLRKLEPSLKSMEEVIAGVRPPAKANLPVDYVSDAQILTQLLLLLKARGAKVA
jgi:hypothetical protein